MQNKKLTIALDCDDVLFDCNEEAVKMLNKAYGTHYSKTDIKHGGIQDPCLTSVFVSLKIPDLYQTKSFYQEQKNLFNSFLVWMALKILFLSPLFYHSVPVPDISPSSDYCRKSIPIMLSLHATSHVFRQTSCLTMVYIILIQLSI